jgi:hypothetical protein
MMMLDILSFPFSAIELIVRESVESSKRYSDAIKEVDYDDVSN